MKEIYSLFCNRIRTYNILCI